MASKPGDVYNNWTVLFSDTHKKYYYFCECKCGFVRSVADYSLKNGKSRGCGCTLKRGRQSFDYDEEKYLKCVKLFKKGYTYRDIMAEEGFAFGTISKAKKRYINDLKNRN